MAIEQFVKSLSESIFRVTSLKINGAKQELSSEIQQERAIVDDAFKTLIKGIDGTIEYQSSLTHLRDLFGLPQPNSSGENSSDQSNENDSTDTNTSTPPVDPIVVISPNDHVIDFFTADEVQKVSFEPSTFVDFFNIYQISNSYALNSTSIDFLFANEILGEAFISNTVIDFFCINEICNKPYSFNTSVEYFLLCEIKCVQPDQLRTL